MSFSAKNVITGPPATQLKKCYIAGHTQVVDQLIKRVVLLNRDTLQLIAAQNVNEDNTWEMFTPDQGDGNHVLIGFDEGGNFNIDGFDRASLGIYTYEVDPSNYDDVLSKAEAYYVHTVKTLKYDNLTPVKLQGSLELEALITGLYFREDTFGGFGYFENEAGVVQSVGVDTAYPEITEGTTLVLGGCVFKLVKILDSKVFFDTAVGSTDGDVFDDDSCVFNFPCIYSLSTTTGHVVTDTNPDIVGFPGFIRQDYEKITDFIPTNANTKVICFEYWTDGMGSVWRIPLLSIGMSLEIGLYNSYEYIQCYTGDGTEWLDEGYGTGGVYSHFVLVRLTDVSTEVYVDDMITPKVTKGAVTFTGAPLIIGALGGHNTTRSEWYQQVKDVKIFNRDMGQTERETLYAGFMNYDPGRVVVDGFHKFEVGDYINSSVKTSGVQFDTDLGPVSPFKDGFPADFKFAIEAFLRPKDITILTLSGTVINVPGDYSTVSAAATAAGPGDIIKVAPGTYPQTVTTTNKYFHIYGDIQEPGEEVIFNQGTRGLYLTLNDTCDPEILALFSMRPMLVQNIKFSQSYTGGGQCYLNSTYKAVCFSLDLINCELVNTGYNFEAYNADIGWYRFRLFNCTLQKGSAYKHFRYLRPNTAKYNARVELYKCLLDTDLVIDGGGEVTYEDWVTSTTEGYGLDSNAPIIATERIMVEPLYFSISPESVDAYAANVRMGIDLSAFPDLFDAISGPDDFSIIFEDGSFLDFEVETYDSITKKGLLWVILPYVSDTDITHYALVYTHSDSANSGPDGDVAHTVWDGYKFVHHMTEDPVGTDSCTDSAGENHGTPSNMAPANKSLGPLGASEYAFNGTDESITLGNLLPTGVHEGVIEVVFKTGQDEGHILSQDAAGWNDRDVNLSIGDPTGVVSVVPAGYLNFEAQGPAVSEVKNVTSTVAVNDGAYHYAGVSWYRDNWGLVLDDAIDVAQIEYKMWEATTDVKVGTDGTAFLNGSVGEILIADTFKDAEYHWLINKSIDKSLISFAHDPTGGGGLTQYTAKSIIIDCADTWGNISYMGLREIDFYYKGSKIPLVNTDYTAYATTYSYSPNLAFDTSESFIDAVAGWQSNAVATNQRLIVVFNSEQTFDSVVVNNHHVSGTATDRGVKNVKIHMSTDSITDTTYEGAITNSTELFDGQLSEHAASNVEDPQEVELPSIVDPVINCTFTANKSLKNIPLKLDLQTTGLDAGDVANWIANPTKIAAASANSDSLKIEKLDWVTDVAAPLWVLIDQLAVGENTITLSVAGEVNPDVGEIGSAIGQEVFQDFLAVYHLCQDPAVAIKDSTGNNANATPVNMDASNLVNGLTVFNGTDEAINLGALFDGIQDAGQVHISFKTSQDSAPLLMQGTDGLQLTATGAVVFNATNTMEGTAVLNDGILQVVTVAHDLHKRDILSSGVDEIPYNIFGSDGSADLIIAGNYLGASFEGYIPELRFKETAEYQSTLALQGKLWLSTLVDTPNDPQVIPLISFDEGSTYKIWSGTAWRAVVSTDDAIHGDTGDFEWHYRDSADTWAKPTENLFNDALIAAIAYPENRNHFETLAALGSTQWTSTGGMTSEGNFTLAFGFNSGIEGLYPMVEHLSADGMLLPGPSIDLAPYTGIITGSKIEWVQKLVSASYDYSQVEVYSYITGGTWQLCSRNEAIPGITVSMDTTGLTLDFKIKAPVDFPEGSIVTLYPKIF